MLTLKHNSGMWFSNLIPRFSGELVARGISSVEPIQVSWYKLKHGLAVILKQKSLYAEACNSKAAIGMSVAHEYGVVSSA